jgi:SAM-dependent methyltransferase
MRKSLASSILRSSVLSFARYQNLSNQAIRSTAAPGNQMYESQTTVDEYLLFHYGKQTELAPFPRMGLDFALKFPQRTVDIGVQNMIKRNGKFGRSLDIGCAVGGLSFELSRHFNEVVGIDFSNRFIQAANKLKSAGTIQYNIPIQGDIFSTAEVVIPSDIKREKVQFLQGDACNLDPSIGESLCFVYFLY